MTASVPAPKSRTLSARRLVLLAGVAGLGVTVLLGGAGLLPQPTSPALTSIAYAQGVQRPMGFADIVDKVKPAVMSVRVKTASGAKMMGFEGDLPFPPNSQIERFFRRFGLPEGATPDEPRAPRNRLVTGQGSGFFITADGYAVTNNHVVDKADTVEVTADDGKTYTAKVIGTDPRTDIALIKVDGRSDFPYVHLADNLGLTASEGALVADPQPNGPAAKAGILAGDVITAVNGNAVKDARDLAKQIGGMAPGGTAKLTVWRKGEEKTFSIALGELPNQREARATTMPESSRPEGTHVPRLRLTVGPAGQVARSGSEGGGVTRRDPNGIASDHGVKTGDVLLDVGRQ